MTACTQPACTGTIVDGYCDVCGSPAGAVPFVPAETAASAALPAPADGPGLKAVRQDLGISPGTEEAGPHDGLYPARVYRHDRRRLLQRLRQSRGRRPVRSSRGSGFSGVTRLCQRARPNGSPRAPMTSSWRLTMRDRTDTDPADPSGDRSPDAALSAA